MRRFIPVTLFVLAACTAPKDGTTDTDTDTDAATDTDVADTDVADTDDTQVPTTCAPTTPPAGLTLRTTEPASGEVITFTRTLEACAGPAGITGQWWVEILGDDGDLICRMVTTFSASDAVTGSACEDCTYAFGGAEFTTPVRTNLDNCELFGVTSAAPFYSGTDGDDTPYTSIGAITGASPDLMHQHVVNGWVQIDRSATSGDAVVTRTAAPFDGETRVTVRYTIPYAY